MGGMVNEPWFPLAAIAAGMAFPAVAGASAGAGAVAPGSGVLAGAANATLPEGLAVLNAGMGTAGMASTSPFAAGAGPVAAAAGAPAFNAAGLMPGIGVASSSAPWWSGMFPNLSAAQGNKMMNMGMLMAPNLMAQAQQPPITPAPPVIPQMQPRGPAPSLASALGSPPFGMPPTTAVPRQIV
jgi:hypothetical protein